MPKNQEVKIEKEEDQFDEEETEDSSDSTDSDDDSSVSDDDSDEDVDVDVDSLIAEVESSQGNDAIRRREIRRRLEEIREARENARANADPYDDDSDWD